MALETETSTDTETSEEAPAEEAGPQSGLYKRLRLLGRGGMGAVYLAEQQQPFRRLVALKVIKPGMDTREVIARFESERQALALMDHPNIARVFDAGSGDDGRPYFAMEYVPGIPITEYCDRNRLTNRERTELFLSVCHAVQHAHQKGIIHRDIKPTNVLVAEQDGKPFPKVIDFGVAKAITQELIEQAAFTQIGSLVGTPEYMSPEQTVLSSDVDTTTDVYSLGVLLYELLVGALPFEAKYLLEAGLAELLRIIREEDPPRPSDKVSQMADSAGVAERRRTNPVSLQRQLAGDLNWIAMKALEKDCRRRYASVSEMAADIRRHLEDQPVLAGPPSSLYRVHKFVRRHKLALSTGLLVAVSLVAGTAVATWQAGVARSQRARADVKASEAERQARQAEEERRIANEQRARAEEQQSLTERQRQQAASQRDANRRLLYVAQMNLAAKDWEANNLDRMETLLRNQIPESGEEDLRGFEWYYFWRLCHSERSVLRFPTRRPLAVTFFPAGENLAVATGGGIELVDGASGRRIGLLEQPGADGVAISGAGDFLLTHSGTLPKGDNSNVVLWDIANRKRVAAFADSVNWPLHIIAFAKDGSRLAFVQNAIEPVKSPGLPVGDISVWDARNYQEIWRLRGVRVHYLAISPDSKTLAASMEVRSVVRDRDRNYWVSAYEIALLDMASGKQRASLKGHKLEAHCIAFSPDSKMLASGSRDNTIKVWNVESGIEVKTLTPGHVTSSSGIYSVAFSPDSRTLASASADAPLTLWDVSRGVVYATLKGHRSQIADLTFSPDGKTLASADFAGTVRFWDLPRTPEFLITGSPTGAGVLGIAISPNGKILALVNAFLELWDIKTGRFIGRSSQERSAMSVAFSPDGKSLATGNFDGALKLWDTATLNVMKNLAGHPLAPGSSPLATRIEAIAFSPNGKVLVTGDHDNLVKVWDFETGKEIATLQAYPPNRAGYEDGGIKSIAFAPDGTVLATVGGYRGHVANSVKLWEASTLRELFTLEDQRQIQSVAFSPKGGILATAGENAVKLWNVSTGRSFATLPIGLAFKAIFSPDGKRIATASRDRSIKVWEVLGGSGPTTGEELATFQHGDAVTSLAFSTDGSILVSASMDGVVKFWRAATDKEVLETLKR
jgi:WD40 repeat protein/serine/threonine protein kinase